jgi:hypothetical protein
MAKTETKKNLYQRISAVMQDVEYLKKDDSVGSGSYAYRAISEEKVTETVRKSLIENGLVILPIEQEHLQHDHQREHNKIVSISTVNTKYKIVNIDTPTEFEIIASSGTGVDSQDKGVGKAMTYAYKYLCLRTFAIPTGEDPDKVHNADLEKVQKEKAKPQETNVPQAKANTATAKQQELILKLNGSSVFSQKEKAQIIGELPKMDVERAAKCIDYLTEQLEARKKGKEVSHV